ncbi:uncharacterized protein [Temnothorax nylanderi]|uniref:uncharacterized protein n=1 Tax=Temnothorax nylanderi TaxID=102681 RepID=UPI003A8AA2D9
MGKYSKYTKKYNEDWEKEPIFSHWLQRTSEVLINEGKPEAYCKLCRTTLRPHRTDLMDHTKAKKHKQAESALPSRKGSGQTILQSYGFKSKTVELKIIDLKLAAHVACHSSVKTVDHLGVLLKNIGKDSKLNELRLHRTKCSKLICRVLAPCMLRELIEDIGDSWYSVILDESTDNATVKHLALMVRYFSYTKQKMITDLLGLVVTPQATAQALYNVFKLYMQKIGLDLKHLLALELMAPQICAALTIHYMHC